MPVVGRLAADGEVGGVAGVGQARGELAHGEGRGVGYGGGVGGIGDDYYGARCEVVEVGFVGDLHLVVKVVNQRVGGVCGYFAESVDGSAGCFAADCFGIGLR